MARFPCGLLDRLYTRVFLELSSVASYSASWRARGPKFMEGLPTTTPHQAPQISLLQHILMI